MSLPSLSCKVDDWLETQSVEHICSFDHLWEQTVHGPEISLRVNVVTTGD